MIRGTVALGFAALITVGMPVATADVVVSGTEVTAKTADGRTTAEVQLINTASRQVTLDPVVTGGGCTVTPAPAALPPLESTAVTLTLEAGCPTDALVIVDVDGSGGSTPVVKVQPAKAGTVAFSVMRGGSLVALVLALLTLVLVRRRVREVAASANDKEAVAQRTAAHEDLKARIEALERDHLLRVDPKKRPEAPTDVTLGWSTPLVGLDASWKVSDSWLANANVGIAGLVTLLTTTGVLDAVLSETPPTVTSTVAITAGLALFLVAVANAALRVFGTQTKVPTVGGFTIAIALCVFATALNAVTIAQTLDNLDSDLGMGEAKSAALWLSVLVLLSALVRYVWVSAGEVLRSGIGGSAPAADPDVVRAAWVVYLALNQDARTMTPTPWDNAQLIAAYGQGGGPARGASSYPPAAYRTSPGDGSRFIGRVSAMP